MGRRSAGNDGSVRGGFGDVDVSGNAEHLARYLALMSAVPAVAVVKRWSIEMLELRPGRRALDVGCGLGDEVRTMASIVGGGGRAVGVDSSRAILTAAQALGGTFEQGAAEQLPFGDATFDAARADRLLSVTRRPQETVNELFRVLRPGGRAVIVESALLFDVDDPILVRLAERMNGVVAGTLDFRLLVPPLLHRAGFGDMLIEHHATELKEPADIRACFDVAGAIAAQPDDAGLRAWNEHLDGDLPQIRYVATLWRVVRPQY